MPVVPRGHEHVSARCPVLAGDLLWFEAIIRHLAVVLAVENWRRLHEMQQGRADVVMLLKYLAKALAKLLAVVFAHCLVEHGPDAMRARAGAATRADAGASR